MNFGKNRPFSRAIVDACPTNTVVWLYRKEDTIYIVGWAKDVRFFPSPIVVKNQPYGWFNYKYQALVRQHDCRILSPGDAVDVPAELFPCQFERGACLDSEMVDYSPEDYYTFMQEFDGEYDDLYTNDDAIEALAPLTIDSVPTLIAMSQKHCTCNRGMWIANLAVHHEPGYKTYLNGASILANLCIFDRAERDYQSALDYKPRDPAAEEGLSKMRAILSQPGCPILP